MKKMVHSGPDRLAAQEPPLCPFNDGRHKFLVTSWGRSCRYCHRTWEWHDGKLMATWENTDAA